MQNSPLFEPFLASLNILRQMSVLKCHGFEAPYLSTVNLSVFEVNSGLHSTLKGGFVRETISWKLFFFFKIKLAFVKCIGLQFLKYYLVYTKREKKTKSVKDL